jgi:hypothetical protein
MARARFIVSSLDQIANAVEAHAVAPGIGHNALHREPGGRERVDVPYRNGTPPQEGNMRFTIIGLATAAALAAITPALAQIAVLPETSRSEAQSGAINRSLDVQGRSRLQNQQNQFEINSLRNEGSRTAAPVVVAPPIAGPAPVR